MHIKQKKLIIVSFIKYQTSEASVYKIKLYRAQEREDSAHVNGASRSGKGRGHYSAARHYFHFMLGVGVGRMNKTFLPCRTLTKWPSLANLFKRWLAAFGFL